MMDPLIIITIVLAIISAAVGVAVAVNKSEELRQYFPEYGKEPVNYGKISLLTFLFVLFIVVPLLYGCLRLWLVVF